MRACVCASVGTIRSGGLSESASFHASSRYTTNMRTIAAMDTSANVNESVENCYCACDKKAFACADMSAGGSDGLIMFLGVGMAASGS